MIDIYLFEIECAEKIGDYKTADILDQKLLKFASQDYKELMRQIEKKTSNCNEVKSINFSPTQKKFVVSAAPELANKIKKEIQSIANPYKVSFKYSGKTIDELMDGDFDPMDRHIDQAKNLGIFSELEEPTDYDLEMEPPADPIDEDEDSLDQLLLEIARDHIRKLL